MRSLAVAVSILLALGGCRAREAAHDESTATIAPEPTGTVTPADAATPTTTTTQ